MLKKTLLALSLLPVCYQAAASDFGRIAPDEISVYVQDLRSGQVLADHRADVPVNPASTMKLVTAFAAFQALGADFRWITEWKSDAPFIGNTLAGDIYWQGSGDPSLDQAGLVSMQQALRDRGISRISGQLVLDNHLWSNAGSADDFRSDVREAFMTAPHPNMLAYKVVWVRPEISLTGAVGIRTNPPLPDIPVDNRVTLSSSSDGCEAPARHMRADYRGGVLAVSGSIPPSCSGKELFVNMLGTAEFAEKSFVNQWRAAGGTVSDGHRTGYTPPGAKTLVRHTSKPLHEILADMNRYSNNVIARTVFLQLGTAQPGDTVYNARRAVGRELQRAGIDTEHLVLENGSGLSRRERLTARMLGQILAAAHAAPFSRQFAEGLPASGEEGTLKTRFRQFGGLLRLKTGTLKNVRALAGYYLGEKPLAVVAVINSSRAEGQQQDLDAAVEKLIARHAPLEHRASETGQSSGAGMIGLPSENGYKP